MKLPIIDLQNKKVGTKELPAQFNEPYRPDLIKRAVLSLQSVERQKYGASPEAGIRTSSEISRRRRKYRGAYGLGVSRVTRKILTRRGTRFFWVGALSPNTRGGRRAHPPKAKKIWEQKINQKENSKAIRSALAATLEKNIVQERGHKVPEQYPFIASSELENINKTKDVEKILTTLNFQEELVRSSIKKVRAGKGKLRGRKYQRKKGILIVVGGECPLLNSARNIPGVEIVGINQLNAKLLAPGSLPGRITIYTEKAIDRLGKEKLYC